MSGLNKRKENQITAAHCLTSFGASATISTLEHLVALVAQFVRTLANACELIYQHLFLSVRI